LVSVDRTERVDRPRDNEGFQSIVDDVGREVNVSARLPDWPFRADSGYADYFEFTRALGGAFGDVLQSLADHHRDEYISLVVLEPGPGEYRRHYGFYPAFRYPAADLADSYWDFISSEAYPEGGAGIRDEAEIIAIGGSSRRWAVWGEWYWGVAVILTDSRVRPWTKLEIPFLTAEEAWENLMAPDHGPAHPASVRDAFLSTARLRGSGRPSEN
jgi:hypothetical protein